MTIFMDENGAESEGDQCRPMIKHPPRGTNATTPTDNLKVMWSCTQLHRVDDCSEFRHGGENRSQDDSISPEYGDDRRNNKGDVQMNYDDKFSGRKSNSVETNQCPNELEPLDQNDEAVEEDFNVMKQSMNFSNSQDVEDTNCVDRRTFTNDEAPWQASLHHGMVDREDDNSSVSYGRTRTLPQSQPPVSSIEELKKLLSDRYDEGTQRGQYITLPRSTHTLLHTEPIRSLPFFFAFGIATLSVSCLLLVLINEMSNGDRGNFLQVPTGVSSGVRGAQFCGVLVGLLMEEEIPQGIILLRSISKASLRKSFPELSYARFVFSCLFRLVMGYLFLLNLFVTLVQADDVIEIFFDILALEFVQHLDDMAFELARKDILGKILFLSTAIKYEVLTREALNSMSRNDNVSAMIQREHEQNDGDQTTLYRLTRYKKVIHFRWILRVAYFINLACLLTGVAIIQEYQSGGMYHCRSLSVNFGDNVWEDAHITNHSNPSHFIRRTLVYSYFNGVYKITGTDSHGYPIYTEQNKLTGDPYNQVIGAEIIYCQAEEAWVFQHRNIIKLGISIESDEECLHWLLRSPQTKEYDLIDVPKEDWSVWTGIITAENKVSMICNVCNLNSDCNYKGECMRNGECFCNSGFTGQHCEFNLPCNDLVDDESMGEYSLARDPERNTTLYSYMRPIYISDTIDFTVLFFGDRHSGQTVNVSSVDIENANSTLQEFGNITLNDALTQSSSQTINAATNQTANETDDDIINIDSIGLWGVVTIVYAGSRWFGTIDWLGEKDEKMPLYSKEYHAFWNDLYQEKTVFVSDPALEGSTPVGVDFYRRDFSTPWDDYGPFGSLLPMHNTSGKGYFHCYGTNTTELKM